MRAVAADRPAWIRPADDGVVVVLRVSPRATRSAVVGTHGAALRVRIAAPPVGGAANRELITLLAGALGVRESTLSLERGAAGRDKCVRVRGMAAEEIVSRLVR